MTAFVGLIVILPVIGFGAWHGYLKTIDANRFPRHNIGITSIPRQHAGDDFGAEKSSADHP